MRSVLIPVFLTALAAFPAYPQGTPPPPADDQPTIKMDVRRVALYVTVREGKAKYVSDLDQKDFRVAEDGKPQDIRQFQREEVPMAIGLVIDNSQSMFNKRRQVVDAAKVFIQSVKPEDEVFVVHFSEDVQFALPKDKPFTNDQAVLTKAVEMLEPAGQTALYDAIRAAVTHLQTSKLTKKALIVVSDGGDNKSASKVQDVVRDADLSGALFYAIGIYDPMDGDANPRALRNLANRTGGEVYFPQTVETVTEICNTIARDLRNQYMVVYSPPEHANPTAYHRVQVQVKDPKGRDLTVRARTGYYGTSPTPSQ
jgi:Ca-activated chloride channel homolog